MIIGLVAVAVVAVALGAGFLLGTTKGKADLAAFKADLTALLPKVKASVASDEATVKADILALVAKVEAGLKKIGL